MADNLGMTPGGGATIATDDVSGVHYQYVKIADGTPDSANKLKVDASGAMRVIDAGVNTAAQAFALNLTTSISALQTGGVNLANRVFIHVQNRGSDDIEINFTGSWTLGQGTIVPSGQSTGFALGPGITLYARAVASTADVRVIEMA